MNAKVPIVLFLVSPSVQSQYCLFVEHGNDDAVEHTCILASHQSRRFDVKSNLGRLGNIPRLVRELGGKLDEHDKSEQLDERFVQPEFRAGSELSAI